jgi:uncharacterized protein YukE
MIWNFNYDKAIRQAEQIEGVAGNMTTLANNTLSGAMGAVNASWDGASSDLFLRHCEETKGQILEKARQLVQTASKIREVARILREAEINARRQMEELSRRAIGGS